MWMKKGEKKKWMNEIVCVCILLTISPSSNHLQSSFPSAILVFGGWLNSSLFFLEKRLKPIPGVMEIVPSSVTRWHTHLCVGINYSFIHSATLTSKFFGRFYLSSWTRLNQTEEVGHLIFWHPPTKITKWSSLIGCDMWTGREMIRILLLAHTRICCHSLWPQFYSWM